MVQALRPPKRYRGFVLTPVGLQKLQRGIQRLEAQTKMRQSPRTIAERVQLLEADGIHPMTVRKILRCQQGVDKRSICHVFEALQLMLEAGDCAHTSLSSTEMSLQTHHSDESSLVNTDLCGRTEETAQLQQKILRERCRLVAVLGVEGIGKTALVKHFIANQDEFECCVWKSLHPATALMDMLASILHALSGRSAQQPTTVEALMTRLLAELKHRRCLLVLDGVEAILENCSLAGYYRNEYAAYGKLFRAIAEHAHASCVILTSQEELRDFKRLQGRFVQAMHLEGLNSLESEQLLQAQGIFSRSQTDLSHITTYYAGNPLILKWLAVRVWNYFDGSLSNYLRKQSHKQLFRDLQDLLDKQFDRFSELEQRVMTQLAISGERVTLSKLQSDLESIIGQPDLLDVLDSLHRRSVLHRSADFKLSPAMTQFLQNKIEATQTSSIVQQNREHSAAALV